MDDTQTIGTTGRVLDKNGVDHPPHYNNHPSGIETIELIRHLPFDLGTAVRYVMRREEKPEPNLTNAQSAYKHLDKAVWYMDDMLAHPIFFSDNPGVAQADAVVGVIMESEYRLHCLHSARDVYAALILVITCARERNSRTGVDMVEALFMLRNSIAKLRDSYRT